MGGVSNIARKNGKENYLEIIKTFNNILLILSLMGLMYALGLCNGNQCAYIEERNVYTGEIITPAPVNYHLAVLIQNITTWFVIGYVASGVYLWKIKKNITKCRE